MNTKPNSIRRAMIAGAPLLPFASFASPCNSTRTHAAPPLKPHRARRPLVRRSADGGPALLELLEGFSCQVVQRAGEAMSDGYLAPRLPDGMACMRLADGRLAVMRNHEIDTVVGAGNGPRPPDALCYDPRYGGGVSRLVFDAKGETLLSSNLVLAGTSRNCSSGPSPFGYLTCEETTSANHGYVFLCDPEADSLQPPRRIPGYGRFRHEAAVVDPATHIAYLTEDQPDSAFYRFVPDAKDSPFVGRLQALAVRSAPGTDTALAATGTRYDVTWVDIKDPAPATDSVRRQAFAAGAARIVRGEGIWLQAGRVYFTATTGGPIGRGQIFALDIAAQTLTVIAASTHPEALDMPDNLTASPDGLLFIAEDGHDGNYIRYLDTRGEPQAFARNVLSLGEFAGPCFTPKGDRLFINMQFDGLTLAIRGPFSDLAEQEAQDGGIVPTAEVPHEAAAAPSDLASAATAEEPDPFSLPKGLLAASTGLSVLALAALSYRKRRVGRRG